MTLNELLKRLVDKFSYLPYGELELTWHQHLCLWDATISYWHVRPGLEKHPWGRTPEEAVRNFVGQLEGKTLGRTGQNGIWGQMEIEESVTCDDVAFIQPKDAPALTEGYNQVLGIKAAELARCAQRVFLKTYIGDRLLKGYPEKDLIPPDRNGEGFRILIEALEKHKADCPVEVGIYDGGQAVGFRGGLL